MSSAGAGVQEYTERYSEIRVTNPLMKTEDVRACIGSNCVFNVDRVRYSSMKGKDVAVIGVVINTSPLNTAGSIVVTLWNFGSRSCFVLLEKQAYAIVQPLIKGTVLMITKPSLTFQNDKMYLVWHPSGRIAVIGTAKDYGNCNHKSQEGKICGATIDRRCGVMCGKHSKVELGRIQKAQAMRPELKGSWAGLTQTYGLLEQRGGRKRKATFLGSPTDGAPITRKSSKDKDEEKILEMAEKTSGRGSRLALLGCVEDMRGLRRGSLKEKEVQKKIALGNSLPELPDNKSLQTKEQKSPEETLQEATEGGAQLKNQWEIEIDGYNSDQNSHSYWLNGAVHTPKGRTDTPCSKLAQTRKVTVKSDDVALQKNQILPGADDHKQNQGSTGQDSGKAVDVGCLTPNQRTSCRQDVAYSPPTEEELVEARRELLL